MAAEPNENGVYDHDAPEGTTHCIEVKQARARVHVIPIENGEWVFSYDYEYRSGNHWGSYGPASRPSFASANEALKKGMLDALRHFAPSALSPYDSCVVPSQRAAAVQMYRHIAEYLEVHCGVHVPRVEPHPEPKQVSPAAPPVEAGAQLSLF